jgi:predicted N-acetyltransferase YhbS
LIIELESFSVHPKWQRKGVGSMLVKRFLEVVDADHAKCFVHSSTIGKPLYEKFGFNTMGELTVDLKEFGDYEPYTTWDMRREAV